MLKSTVVQIPINRAYDEVYAIVQVPENYRLWSPVLDARFEPRGNDGLDWLVELPTGLNVIRFTAPDSYGVLDYAILSEAGEHLRSTAVRLIRNNDECELIIVFVQQPGQSEEAFDSYVEWARNDFMALKSVVETL